MKCLKNFCFWLFKLLFVLFVIYFNTVSGRTAAPPTTALKLKEFPKDPNRIPIGVVFGQNTNQIQYAFKLAVIQHSKENTLDFLNFEVFVDVINTADSFKLSRLVCNQFARGVVALLAAVHSDSFDTFHSYANTFHMPFVAPFFPEKVLTPSSGLPDYAMSILPDYHKAVLETVAYYGWKNVIYLYDSQDGMLRLQQIFRSLTPGKPPYFRIANVKRITNAKETIAYLRQLEKFDRWSNKYIILDCSTTNAKETLIHHVRDVQLGRRNYHYLLSGLVFDERWEQDISEYGTINMTGFKLIDTSRKFVKDYFNTWKMESMAAKAALMYDASHMVLEAFQRILKYKPHIMASLMNKTNTKYRYLSCDTQEAIPLKYGDEIAEFFKRTQVEGLSGKIRFSSSGVRKNFSLVVVQNNPEGEMIKIGNWYDDKGFIPIKKLNGFDTSGKYDRGKTYTVVSIHEPPYFTSSRPRKQSEDDENNYVAYSGFCAELAELIAEKLQIKIKFQLSADGKYGNINPNMIGGWDGMIGELVRNEADMVIAPLIVSEERETAVDFSKPFLSFNQIANQSFKDKISWFGFLKPLSTETWILLASSVVLVGIVMFVVSRFSPMQWRVVAVADPTQSLEGNEDPAARGAIRNELTNSVWYSVGSMLYHGNILTPTTFSRKIISTVWWFFVLIMMCSYTAYLASQLTLSGMETPLMPAHIRMAHCPEDMPANKKKEMIVDDEVHGNEDNMESVNDYTYSNCEMLVTVLKPGIKDFAVAFPKGSKLRTGVNLALTAMREEGVLNKLVNQHFFNYQCGAVKPTTVGGNELTLGEIVGLFCILLCGMLGGLFVAVYEYSKYHRSNAASTNPSTNRPLNTKSRLEMHEEQEALNATMRRRRDQERDQERGWNASGTSAPRSYGGFRVSNRPASAWSLRGKAPRHILSIERRRQILAQEEREKLEISNRVDNNMCPI